MDIDNLLRELAARYETPSFIEGDPSWWMHQVFGADNQEATAFVAQALSYDLPAGSKACYYRLYTVDVMHDFLEAYRQLLSEYGTLGTFVGNATGLQAVEAVTSWFSAHGGSAVIPKDATSCCKRVCMFLRWMVRDGSPVDLGLWSSAIDKRTLIMPMDTHVLQQSVRLGLLQSKTTSMSAARRLTARLAQIFPEDPLRGDFALFGEGVSAI